MKKEVTFNIRVNGAEVKDGVYQMNGIPRQVWDTFLAESKLLMPDMGDGAWSELITSVILSVCKEKERVILMNKIPDFVYDATQKVCDEAETSIYEILKGILESASQNNFYLAVMRETEPEKDEATIVFTGVPNTVRQHWDIIADLANSVVTSGEVDKFRVTKVTQDDDNKNTLIFTNIPDATMKYWEDIAKNYNKAHLVASNSPSNLVGADIIGAMLANSATGQVETDFKVTDKENNEIKVDKASSSITGIDYDDW